MAIKEKTNLTYTYKNKDYSIDRNCLIALIDAMGFERKDDLDETLLSICKEHKLCDDIFLENINNIIITAQ